MPPQSHRAGLRLRLYRIALGKTPEAVAADLGVSRAALYRYEAGHVVKLETVQQIADVMGLTFEQVIAPLSRVELAQADRLAPIAATCVATA